ncbi:MAG: polysaccharide biosynthesis tyrosine autokinase [Candidatus Coatesbacteria bacterium]|nr:polysaccharide biosynthesis tyrosine autokinase [Candidatus Coatesbacteria bacterium]
MATEDFQQQEQTAGRPPSSEGPRLADYLLILRKRKWIIIFAVVSITAFSAYRTFSTAPTYVAACSLVLETQGQENFIGGYYSNYYPYRLETEIQIISSRSTSLGVVDKLNLAFEASADGPQGASFISPWVEQGFPPGEYQLVEDTDSYELLSSATGESVGRGTYSEPFVTDDGLMGFTLEDPSPSPDKTITIRTSDPATLAEGIRQSTIVRKAKEGNTIIISVRRTDPQGAAELANAVAEVYVEENLRWKQSRARRAREFIGEQIEVAELKLRNTEDMLRRYKEETGLVTFTNEAAQTTQRLSNTEARRYQIATDLSALYAVQDAIEELTTTGELGVEGLTTLTTWQGIHSDPVLQAYAGEIGRLLVERQQLEEQTGPLNPRLQAIDGQLTAAAEDLREQLRQSRRRGYISGEIERLEAQLGGIDEEIAALSARIGELPKQEMELALRQRRADVANKIHTMLLERYEEARINESMETGDARILDQALVPRAPVSPNHTSDILIGLLIGIVVGVGLAVIIELNDTTLKTAEETSQLLGIRSVGVIPKIADSERPPEPYKPLLLSHPRSPVAESYRILRTNLQYFSVDRKLELITVTSPSKGDGKTTLSSNLGLSFAQQGLSTLLVDTDLRKAELQKYFSVPTTPGITELILGDREDDECIRPTGIDDLYLLPAGHLPPNPSELLASKRCRRLVERLRQRFDRIVMDTSPVLAVTDPAILSTLADGAILVLQSESTEADAAREAVAHLRKARANILGFVLNKVDLTRTYKSHRYYYYYYHRGEVDSSQKRSLWQRFLGKK